MWKWPGPEWAALADVVEGVIRYESDHLNHYNHPSLDDWLAVAGVVLGE